MQLITLSNRRWRLWLLIIASLVLLVVIAALLPGDASPPRRHNVGGGAGTAAVASRTFADQRQQHQRERDAVNYVLASGNFADRVVAFNAFLSSLRAEELKRRGGTWSGGAWRRPASRVPVRVVSGASDDYLRALSNYSRVATVVLPWLQSGSGAGVWSSLDDASNVPLQTIPRVDGRRHAVLVDRDAGDDRREVRRGVPATMQPERRRHSAGVVAAAAVSQRETDQRGHVLAERRHLVPGTLLHRYASARLLRAYSSRCSRH